ncbi:MAG: DUF3883 domain-containing protein [Chloroflexi bacterium]|nr:DUF3883 domain-containing protein [Chloroflexota bacterium]
MSATKTRRQSVNFLGFLRGQLSGLSGIPTLCYELIQNADDAKDENNRPGGASRIIFDICDDALWVENDGIFREIDFDRMEKISWGNKREEADTTGSFGIGFISVYQITDSPELFSSGEHWQFNPQAPENERIVIEEVDTQFTRFRLPWAFEISQVRKELNIAPVRSEDLDYFADQFVKSIENSALFLKQLHTLEVKRNNGLLRRIELVKEENELLLDDGNQLIKWSMFEGNFDLSSRAMRQKFGELIEKKRTAIVKVAIPEEPLENGLLYAFLPSETHTGLPFHINADFYPSPDRKRILFDQDFRSDWNRLAIECVAQILSDNLDELLALLSPPDFWKFAEKVKLVSGTSIHNAPFDNLWVQLRPKIRTSKTALTTAGSRVRPPESNFLERDSEQAAANIFEDLKIPTIHPDLRKYRNILIDTDVQLLKISTVGQALSSCGLSGRKSLPDMLPSLQSPDNWPILWCALNSLWDRASHSEQEQTENALSSSSIAFGSDSALWPPEQLYKADEQNQALFSKFSDVIWFDDKGNTDAIPTNFVKSFDLEAGIHALETIQDLLLDLWEAGLFSPKEIYEWMEHHPEAKYLRDTLRERIRKLNIWPTADGKLTDLGSLFLPGGFEDPLNMARFVDIELLGGRREFLERHLRVSSLDFVTYSKEWIPSVVNSEDFSKEKRIRLLEIMARHIGEMQGDHELHDILRHLQIVWCGDEKFCAGSQTYFDSPVVREVLGDDAQITHIPEDQNEAIRALYEWLGVSAEPNPKDVIERVRYLTSGHPSSNKVQSIQTIFDFLASNWIHWEEDLHQQYRELQQISWLPGTKSADQWYKPSDVYATFRRHLFESQGNFIIVDLTTQQKNRDLIRYLGIKWEPEPKHVVRHLIHCSEKGVPVTKDIFTFLNQNVDNPSILWLKGKACLLLKGRDDEEEYFKPNQVFWEEHPFGTFRFRLSPEFGQYKELFDKLGVNNKPDANDAIDVLLEIADSRFAQSNIPIPSDSEYAPIIQASWKLLSDALEAGAISKSKIKKSLSDKKTIPSTQDYLSRPDYLFFEDRPGWSEKFELIKGNITDRVEGTWLAMEAAGVRRVSKTVKTELHQCDNPRADAALENRLVERKNLILRIIDNHRQKGIRDFNFEILDDLSFMQADEIDIIRSFHGFGRREDHPESVDSIHIDGTLYFCSRNGSYPWIGIARELSYILHDSGELSSLGMELKEILSPDSAEEASENLDEFGYPRVKSRSGDVIESTIIEDFGGSESEGDDWVETPDEYPDDTLEIIHPTHETAPKGDIEKDKPKIPAKKTIRKSTKLVSYVYPEEVTSDKETDPTIAKRLKERGQKGVYLVIKYEGDHGRDAEDMEETQKNFEGFDVRSVDRNDPSVIRYIEVKSTSGLWDSANPAQMHKAQFETAQERGESYWLYVVEQVESDDPKIHRIKNPANRVDVFMFDHGWQPLADATE